MTANNLHTPIKVTYSYINVLICIDKFKYWEEEEREGAWVEVQFL